MTDNTATPSVSYANQDANKALASIASLLQQANQLLPVLRSEFRGEAIQQYPDGSVENVQVSKPLFVRLDYITNKPIKKVVEYKSGPREVYIVNDEAVEEVLSMLKFMGLNDVTRLTNHDDKNIRADLMEFECKLAAVLMLKQKEWGLDKELLPITMTKIKTIVQDARYMALHGATIKAIQKTVQRIESYSEGDKKGRSAGPYA